MKMDPDLFNKPETYSASDVFDSAAHEVGHAIETQYGGEFDTMSETERQKIAEDFAKAVVDALIQRCKEKKTKSSESAPGRKRGDWSLPPEDTRLA
jgi:hypothetical protein